MKQLKNRAGARSAGFTMIELITVMILIGILSAVAASRYFARETFDARVYSDQAKSIMRAAQKLAVAQNRYVYVSATADRFAACLNQGCTSVVPAPGGTNSGSSDTQARCLVSGSFVSTWLCEGRPSTVTLSSSRTTEAGGASSFFVFDPAGRPYNAADATGPAGLPAVGQPANSSFASPLVLTFSGAGVSYTVTVEAETGYVH